MLEVQGLQAGYGKKEVLRDLSFLAEAGKITAVMGPNGCGKSTLLKAMCGILEPTAGQLILDGRELRTLSREQRARKVAYLAQTRQLPDMTVGRLVLHGRFPYLQYPRRYSKEDLRIARQVMEQLDIAHLDQTPLCQLSGGQQQKAYIAMALAQDTDVILLDEPTTYLDVAFQLQVLQQARALADRGKHVLMVIHDLSHGMETADRILVMQKGRLVAQGTPETVYTSGILDRVFGVRVRQVETQGRWHYFCGNG